MFRKVGNELDNPRFGEFSITQRGNMVVFEGFKVPELTFERMVREERNRENELDNLIKEIGLSNLLLDLDKVMKRVLFITDKKYNEQFTQLLAAILDEIETVFMEISTNYSDRNDLVTLRDYYSQKYTLKPSYSISSTFCS